MSTYRKTRSSPAVNETASPSGIDSSEAVNSPKPLGNETEDLNNEEMLKNAEEEEEEEDISDESGESEGEGREMVVEVSGDQNTQQVYEETVPVTLNLKSGTWELRDQFLWPVTFPVDLLAYDCNDYVAYNLRDPRIDTFALRTVEEMDFPIGFDVSVAKSIRAQLMALIPILWKEKVSVLMQERRAASTQRRSAAATANQIPSAVSSVVDEEEIAKLLANHNNYPLNAVRKLLKGPGGDDAQNEAQQNGEDDMDVDDEETSNIKKRKRALEGDAAGRKKRKRGTAFEAHNLVDERIPIRLNLALAGVQLQDQFDWDPATPLYWSDIFARRMSTELGLPREMELAISIDIKRQVLGYLGYSTHQLPPDWAVPASSVTTTTNSQPTLNSSSSLIPKNAIYFPTRSLPILSLHNVIRPPQISSSFGPALSAHSKSQQRWDKLNSRQRTRTARPAAPKQPTASPSAANPTPSSQSASTPSSNIVKPIISSTAPRPTPIR
jgi:hypothetical protein